MSVPQLSDLFSVLPHDDMMEMMALLPKEQAERIRRILSDREASARILMSSDFLAMAKEVKVGDALTAIRRSGREHSRISYIYIVSPENVLVGVVDLRDVVLAAAAAALGDLLVSPVVSAEEDHTRDDLADLFAKYHYRMIPVVDARDHLLGVVHYNDIMKGLVTRART